MRKTIITASLFVICTGSIARAEQAAPAPAPEPCSLLCILKGGPQRTEQPAQSAPVAASTVASRSGFRRAAHRRFANRRPIEVVEEVDIIPLRRGYYRRWRHAAHVRHVASRDREIAAREPRAKWLPAARIASRRVPIDETPQPVAVPAPAPEPVSPPIAQEQEARATTVPQESKPANPFGGLSVTGLK